MSNDFRGGTQVYGPNYLREAEPSLPEKYIDSAPKNCLSNLTE